MQCLVVSLLICRYSGRDIYRYILIVLGFPGGLDGEESVCNAGELDLNPGLGRSPGEGNGNPLQYSCLEIPMDRSLAGSMESQRGRTECLNTITMIVLIYSSLILKIGASRPEDHSSRRLSNQSGIQGRTQDHGPG